MSIDDSGQAAGGSKPSAGGMYDYYLGGSDHTPIDAHAAEQVAAKVPQIRGIAHGNRVFLQRATRWMAGQGIRQFIDVGAGLPTAYNTYESAQKIASDARVVYVDNDPNIYVHAVELLRQQGARNVVYITGDVRDPQSILGSSEVRDLISFDEPVGYLQTAIYHFVSPEDDPYGLVRQYMDAVPSGSYLALSHGTGDGQNPAEVQALVGLYRDATEQLYPRTTEEIERFFDGLELVPPYPGAEPGITWCNKWHAPKPTEADITGSWALVGVGRKP